MTKNSQVLRELYSYFITFCINFDTLDRIISKFAQFFKNDPMKGTKQVNFKIFHCAQRANWGQL